MKQFPEILLSRLLTRISRRAHCETVCTTFPAGAEWISSYRTCKIHSFKLRACTRNITENSICVLMIQTRQRKKSEFVESIKADVEWLGADWEDRLFFASDYFDQMYEAADQADQKRQRRLSVICLQMRSVSIAEH